VLTQKALRLTTAECTTGEPRANPMLHCQKLSLETQKKVGRYGKHSLPADWNQNCSGAADPQESYEQPSPLLRCAWQRYTRPK